MSGSLTVRHLRRRHRLAVAVASLIGVVALAAGGMAAEPPSEAEIDFEATFALRISTSPDANLDFGMPLDPADAAELHRRQAVAIAYGSLQPSMQLVGGFAGSWIDHQQGGRPVIAVTTKGDVAALARLIGDGIPDPVYVFVEYSLLELDEAAAAVDASLGEFTRRGIKFVFAERDVMGNRIRVGLVDPTPAHVAFVRGLGDPITVEDADPVIGSACTGRTNCVPFEGGTWWSKNGALACTIGFNAASGSSKYLVSAGHCIDAGQSWQHPAGTNRGTATKSEWVLGTTSTADAARLFISGGGNTSNEVLLYPVVHRSITSRQALTPVQLGEVECFSAPSTDETYTCGTLVSTGNTLCIQRVAGGPCVVFTQQRRMSVNLYPGDSGGPVFNGGMAIGVGSAGVGAWGGDMSFSHIRNVETELGVIVTTN